MISDGKFPKKEHLLKTGDFRKVYKDGKVFKRDKLSLYRLANGMSHNRIGFVIGKRYVKLANRRNRIKRLLREAYRRSKKDIGRGFDIIVVVKKDPGKQILYKDISGSFLKLITEAGFPACEK